MLRVLPLKRNQIAQMLPVLRQVDPTLALPRLRRLVDGGATRGTAGVMAVVSPDGMIRGGFAYEVKGESDGTVLTVHHMAIPELGRARVAELVENALQTLTRTLRCGAIRIELRPGTDWVARYFADRGYAIVQSWPPAPIGRDS